MQNKQEPEFAKILANITAQRVWVGATMRSIHGYNNTINLAPALIMTKDQVDRIVSSIKKALEVFNN